MIFILTSAFSGVVLFSDYTVYFSNKPDTINHSKKTSSLAASSLSVPHLPSSSSTSLVEDRYSSLGREYAPCVVGNWVDLLSKLNRVGKEWSLDVVRDYQG
jgi:hypothetical protein